MRKTAVAVLLGTLLCATSCSPVVRNARKRANTLIEQGDKQKAEEHVARTMSGVVTNREFAGLSDLRCDIRMEVATDEVARMKRESATLEEIQQLHEYVRRCPDFGEVDNKITNLGIELAEGVFEEVAEPKAAQGDYFGALAAAVPAARHLPKGHPRGEWIEAQRSLLAAPLAAGHAKYSKAGYPITAAVFGRLHNRTQTAPELPAGVEAAVAQASAVRRTNGTTLLVDADCARFLSTAPYLLSSGANGAPYEVTGAAVTGCSVSYDIVDDVEYYEEPVKKIIQVPTKVAVSKPVTRSYTTVTRSCSTSKEGFSGCSTVSSSTTRYTATETSYITVMESKETIVMEPRSRNVRFGKATLTAKVGVRIAGYGTQESATADATVASDRVKFEAGASNEFIKDRLAASGLVGRFAAEVPATAVQASDAAAQAGRIKEMLRESDAAIAAGEVDRGRELALVGWAAGAPLSPAQIQTFEVFGVNLASYPVAGLPSVAALSWLNTTAKTDPFVQAPLDSLFEGIIVRGYPTNVISIGGGYRQPEPLLAQPDRAAADVVIDGDLRWSLMTGKFHRGLGLLFGVDWGVSIGKRLGPDYERSVPLPIYVDEESAKEPGVTLGMRFGLPVMAGFRVYFVSLFAGVRPTYTNFSIGHFFSEGGSIPWAGRLELRLQERYPLVIEGWYGGLAKGPNEDIGATLLLPVRPSTGGEGGLWLRARFDRTTAPAEMPGLFEKDDVYVPSATSTSGSLSFGFAF